MIDEKKKCKNKKKKKETFSQTLSVTIGEK